MAVRLRLLITALIFCQFISFAAFANNDKSDESEKVQQVVVSAYVEGIHKEQNVEKIRAGFHPEFIMFVNKGDAVDKVLIADWISRIEAGNKKRAESKEQKPSPKITYEFDNVEVSGNAAVARLKLFRDDKHIFTDMLSLYKFGEDWKIVAKIFQRH